MTAFLAVHLPGTVAGFGPWLAAHWPTAPRGCQWSITTGWHLPGVTRPWHWQVFCRW